MDEGEAQALAQSSNAKKKEYLIKKQKQKKALNAVGGDPGENLSTEELLALLDEDDGECPLETTTSITHHEHKTSQQTPKRISTVYSRSYSPLLPPLPPTHIHTQRRKMASTTRRS